MDQAGRVPQGSRLKTGYVDCPGSVIDASIIIPTKNGEVHLRSLLEALYCQNGGHRIEVIVIDSGSTDGTLAIATQFPGVRLVRIQPEEFGHGKTRNQGARMARGTYLVFLPQDATPASDTWLSCLLEPFADPVVAGVFGRQVARASASPMERHFLSRTYRNDPEVRLLGSDEEVSLARCFFSTVSGVIRAVTWTRHPFREDIIMSEDQAWARDVLRAGYAIAYQPGAVVLHSHQYSIADVFRRNFDSGYSIRQIFGGVTGIALKAVFCNLADETAFVVRNGSASDWLRYVPYETARHLGFWMGLHARWLPAGFRRACSGLKYFWDSRGREWSSS